MRKRYNLILFVICLFSFIFNVNASTMTYNRENIDNYGVNKKWKITEKNKQNILRTPLVDAREKIYDFSNILSDEDEKLIYNKIVAFTKKTGMDVVILTNSIPYTEDKVNEDYASDFYDYNDFGIDFENYSGLILFRNTYASDPYYSVYWFGEAQLYYTSRTDYILDNIYIDFKSGNYVSGLNNFFNMINRYYDDGIPYEMQEYFIDDMGFLKKKYQVPWSWALLVSAIGTIITISTLVNKNKMIRKALEAKDYLDKENINYSIKQDILTRSRTTHYTISTSSGSGSSGGGFSSSSGSSGGGHTGGGRHG